MNILATAAYPIAKARGLRGGKIRSEEQLQNYCKPQDYGEFAVLPKEIGKQTAYLEGFHWGVQTAKWYKYNIDQLNEKCADGVF